MKKQSSFSRNNYKCKRQPLSPTVTLFPLGLFSRFQKSQFLKFTSQKQSAPDYYFTVTSTLPSKTLLNLIHARFLLNQKCSALLFSRLVPLSLSMHSLPRGPATRTTAAATMHTMRMPPVHSIATRTSL